MSVGICLPACCSSASSGVMNWRRFAGMEVELVGGECCCCCLAY